MICPFCKSPVLDLLKCDLCGKEVGDCCMQPWRTGFHYSAPLNSFTYTCPSCNVCVVKFGEGICGRPPAGLCESCGMPTCSLHMHRFEGQETDTGYRYDDIVCSSCATTEIEAEIKEAELADLEPPWEDAAIENAILSGRYASSGPCHNPNPNEKE